MAYYRIYELDRSAKHIGAVHPVTLKSDAEAMQLARRFTDQAAVEVWEPTCLVARLEPTAAANLSLIDLLALRQLHRRQ